MEVEWKEWNGKQYLLNDFRGARNNGDLLNVLQKEVRMISDATGKNPILSNYTDVNLTTDFFKNVKNSFKNLGGKKVSRSAVLGMKGLAKVMMDMFLFITRNKQTKTFKDEKTALLWMFS